MEEWGKEKKEWKQEQNKSSNKLGYVYMPR
jgi:hypothetical protein